jgi:IS1 family transposase
VACADSWSIATFERNNAILRHWIVRSRRAASSPVKFVRQGENAGQM